MQKKAIVSVGKNVYKIPNSLLTKINEEISEAEEQKTFLDDKESDVRVFWLDFIETNYKPSFILDDGWNY